MLAFTRSFTVDCPLDVAFRDVADLSTAQDWDPGIQESRRVGEGPIGVGTRFEIVARFRGREVPMRYEITELVEGERIVVEGDAPKGWARDTITFAPEGERRTRVTYDTTMGMKGAWRVGEPFLRGTFDDMGRHALEGLERWLQRRCAEAGAPDAAG